MIENRTSAPAPGVYTPPQERSTHGCSSGAAEEHPRSKEHFAPTDWEARLAEAVAKNQQRRAQQRAERAEKAERRNYGLAQRHARKLARNRQEKQP